MQILFRLPRRLVVTLPLHMVLGLSTHELHLDDLLDFKLDVCGIMNVYYKIATTLC
ncbi:hypothetical protein PF004_g31698 [Phytophthora fragariae]|uniref:Uncharacterized protein n=1 Tax=Phytophthora fragariae TaxID=53985 RepID=A0A6G0M8C4_9STRA|nr:hypothetical protein PF004_g31698 [Phytophthora fragariae]